MVGQKTPSQSNSTFPEGELDPILKTQSEEDDNLVQWVISRVTDWEDHRDQNYKQRWNEYYRLWRGIWTDEDKTRDNERSHLISPALQQAIESTVAELEESTFGRGPKWIDLRDDVIDAEQDPMGIIRDRLIEDYQMAGVEGAISEIFLNGAIYGTGIGKIIIDKIEERNMVRSEGGSPTITSKERILVKLEAVSPRDFVIDSNARSIAESLGVAHIVYKPKHSIVKKQKEGIYNDIDIGSPSEAYDLTPLGEASVNSLEDQVRIVEYHGLVPRSFLSSEKDKEEEGIEYEDILGEEEEEEEFELVEAIITIANDQYLLKARENPYMMKDRGFLAYQHDTVPGRFWGRGIAEKGYNPQKALDAELRARIDSLALTVYPMMAGDMTRLPRGMDLQVKPGKNIFTQGNPRDILLPMNFGNIDPNTFRNSADLERMIQMATGAMDSATPVGTSPRNDTASGMAMIQGGSIKRNKRTLSNIGRNLLEPLIEKSIWRYIQFYPERYPTYDYKFRVTSTMGVMARELEQQQLISLISTVPPESPAFWVLMKSIYNNSSLSNRDELLQAIDQMQQAASQPQPPPQPDPVDMARVEVEKARVAIEDKHAQVAEREVGIKEFELRRTDALEHARLLMDKATVEVTNSRTQAEAILALAKAEAAELGSQINKYKAILESLPQSIDVKVDKVVDGNKQALTTLSNGINSLKGNQDKMAQFVSNSMMQTQDSIGKVNQQTSQQIQELNQKVDALSQVVQQVAQQDQQDEGGGNLSIERDKNGLVQSVNGKTVIRDEQGLIKGLS